MSSAEDERSVEDRVDTGAASGIRVACRMRLPHAEVLVISKRLVLFGCACITAVMLWPARADAQVVVSAGVHFGHHPYYYRPYYRPYLYGGFYPFYHPFYAPFYGPYWYGYGYGYPGRGYYYGPSYASARIEVKPRNAQVYLDGYYVGVVDQFDGVFQRLDLPTGEHELTVYLPGYRSYRQKTLFRPGEGYHFKAILEPQAAGEAAEPHPTPSADDPYRAPQQDPRYREPREQGPPNEQGRTRPLPERSGDRRAPDTQGFGTLNVRVQPADAVVVIDGERWDSPEGGSRLIVELSAGAHRIEVRKDGFKPYTSTIQIRSGQTETLNISLPPQ
jgi:hypothetical protein